MPSFSRPVLEQHQRAVRHLKKSTGASSIVWPPSYAILTACRASSCRACYFIPHGNGVRRYQRALPVCRRGCKNGVGRFLEISLAVVDGVFSRRISVECL